MQATTATSLSIALVAYLWQAAASGQAIYRCGDRYSDRPCNGAAPLALQDPRTADQQKQAQDAVRRMEEQASSLEKSRHKAEAARPQGTGPAVLGNLPSAKPANPPASQATRTAKSKAPPEHFTARSLQPAPGKK